jgi:hypothetical protein
MYHKTMYIVNMYYIAKLHTWCTTYHKTIDLVWQNEIYSCAKWHLLSLYFWDKISYMHILACPPVHAAPRHSEKIYFSQSQVPQKQAPRAGHGARVHPPWGPSGRVRAEAWALSRKRKYCAATGPPLKGRGAWTLKQSVKAECFIWGVSFLIGS